MRTDTVIMGGGLSGLACGIALCRRGQRVTIVSGGQSLLHFNGGSMELLGYHDGKAVTKPLDALQALPSQHPYCKIGVNHIQDLATQAHHLLTDAGIAMSGDATSNHWRITPMGVAKPAWLTLNDHLRIDDLAKLPWQHVALMSIRGFLDQPVAMLANGLRKLGMTVDVHEFTTPELTALRHSPSEMRASSIAKRLVSRTALEHIAQQVNGMLGNAEAILMPAVLQLTDNGTTTLLQTMLNKPMRLVATLPPAVAGSRMQAQLRHYFQMLGGVYLLGDTAIKGDIQDGKVTAVSTSQLGDMPLRADNYVLATGSFISKGLVADYEHIYEPVMGVDVDADGDREKWSQFGFMEEQAYMGYGVATDGELRCLKGGQVISNLWAIGSVLSGHDSIKAGDGTGVSLLTALAVANRLAASKPFAKAPDK